jgi:hypothetical protein
LKEKLIAKIESVDFNEAVRDIQTFIEDTNALE